MNQTSIPEYEKFQKYLVEHGLRKTPERFEILKFAERCEGHFDVDMLYEMLETHGYHVSKATVYSTLELLCGAGIVRKLLFDTHVARYEKASMIHSHFVCLECGSITEVDLGDIDARLASMQFSGFKPAYVSTCIYGVCGKCAVNN